MSHSQHPVALRLEQRVGGAARLLATVMALPLVDGIFPAMVLAGTLSDPAGILEVGLLVFGGSATVAVILAEMSGSRRERVETTLAVGVVVLVLAGVEAALAPTIESLLDLAVFERFAALVILAIAAKTASARVGEYLPRPAVIVGLGMVASLDPANAQLVLVPDPTLVLRGLAAAGTGVAFALAVAVTSPWLHDAVDIDRFRFGSAVALGVLGLSVLGLVPDDAPLALAVLGVTTLLAFDPGEVDEEPSETTTEEAAASTTADEETDIGPDRAPWL
ncbi:DUF5794 domain-containing protein [Halococcus dombrowskii]|uniref:DUF5794 domain-containing protein n=1 Tax=Halococcus dombrowskii TaxID=179637 RepID=A0AAV3SKE4_HALDO|nr:DUF5794 domain-containing protein [Halococcus dombrowskii]UOO93784.1 DUF5794 domain-containing protein [Halococcus dombrowskii]